jgi:hypothetical protein
MTMDNKYQLLINALDKLRSEAPDSYKTYLPIGTDIEAINKARSLSFIHLLLKVRFGVSSFIDRHKLITDGPQDGGIDAFYIDAEQKKLFMIQSKFATTSENFQKKNMTSDEIIKMEISRITKGEKLDSNGVAYNDKIKAFQAILTSIRDIAKYDYVVIFLGNVKHNDEQIRRLIDNCFYEIYDNKYSYEKLIFPLVTGTNFDPDEIIITLEIKNKEHPRLKQLIDTEFGNYNLTTLFVPTKEIGKMLSKYKNAILKYNPRNFLSLQKRSVNEKIRKSIIESRKNNFALLNNGITVLSQNINFSDNTGKINEGQLILTKPQILNGGQTAFTLSVIYDEYKNKSEDPLDSKEVLVKIITPIDQGETIDLKFIELISNATNQQNEVSEADRRSNHEVQINIQNFLYSNYGYLYERKSGEFHDGITEKFVDENIIINRLDFIKAYKAYLGFPAAARRSSESVLFQEDNFFSIMSSADKFNDMFFAYLIFDQLKKIESEYKKKKADTIKEFGYSLLYGKWALISSIGINNVIIQTNKDEIFSQAENLVRERLAAWRDFDDFVRKKRKDSIYFAENRNNYELYYKVNLLDEDIKEFFLK